MYTLLTSLLLLLDSSLCQHTPHRTKRRRSQSPVAGSSPPAAPIPRPTPRRRDSESSLPPSSPPAPFSDTDDSLDERDAVRDVEDDAVDADEDGEDLFGEDMEGYVFVLAITRLYC